MRISDWSSALCSSDLARGLELDPENVAAAMARGLSVVQGDADTDLGYYQDDSFDYAILSQTLQTTKRPDLVIGHLLRARTSVVRGMRGSVRVDIGGRRIIKTKIH